MSREPDKTDPFARMAAALRDERAVRPARRKSQPSFSELAPVIPPAKPVPVKGRTRKKGRVARSEPLPSLAIAGETRPQQATESGPELPSVMIDRPVLAAAGRPAASLTIRRQIAAPTVRFRGSVLSSTASLPRRRGRFVTMTTRRKSAVLLFLAFSLSVFALGVTAFFFARTHAVAPAPRVNAASQPPPQAPSPVDAHLSASLLAKPPQH